MTRHLIDRHRDTTTARLQHFLKITRQQMLQPSSRNLFSGLRLRASQRLRAYARIARGGQA